jgi:DNA-directed RNA polymerase sigma subunit (sigma70/sigma32)
MISNEPRRRARSLLRARRGDRERHVIRGRFGLLGHQEQTLEEIGRALRLSRERVRQIEVRAKEKLRARLYPHRECLA